MDENKFIDDKRILELFFNQTPECHFFMMLDEPVKWNDSQDKEAVLEHVFHNQRITKINEAMLLLYKAREKDFIGLRLIDFFKDRIEYGKSLWRRLFDEGRAYVFSNEKRYDGTTIWVEGYYACLYDDEGRIIGHVGVHREATEKRKAEAERKQKEERYKSLVESQKDFVVRIDNEGNYVYVNDAYCDAIGLPYNQILGRNISETLIGDRYSKARDAIANVKNPPYSERFEVKEEVDNSIRWLLWEGYGIRDINNKVVEIQAVGRDITEEKLKQLQLKDTKDKLEKKIEEGNKQLIVAYTELEKEVARRIKVEEEKFLLRDQLYQSQKMEALGMLAGGVAHDFNNLMSVISGYTQLLMWKTGEKYEYAGDLTDIYNATMKASKLTSQLLLFSRQQSIEKHNFDLNKCVKNLLSMIERIIGEDISIDFALYEQECVIYADQSNIEQVVMNLIINARDAMPEGGKITIETHIDNILQENDSESSVVLKISDTGKGIPKNVQDRIFEPFFTTKGPKSGTGLGLAVVYGIIKNHKGTISFESTEGVGTSFTVKLPLQTLPNIQDGEEDLPFEETGKHETILLVEDDKNLGMINSKALRIKGFNVLSAQNYESAMLIFEENINKIDVVVSDVILPDGNGIELAKKMLGLKSSTGIVLTSGYTGDKVDLEKIKDSVFFLQKPYRLDVLVKEISTIIKAKKDV